MVGSFVTLQDKAYIAFPGMVIITKKLGFLHLVTISILFLGEYISPPASSISLEEVDYLN